MEKKTPHNKLSLIKELVLKHQIRSTASALAGAASLGLNFEEMQLVLMGLNRSDFYKSMTTHVDHKIWQDVYHAKANGVEIYIKITVIEMAIIVSFKEL
jgi:motility quorum-sensing regulator/GCU-specific mRNA interferase toxin